MKRYALFFIFVILSFFSANAQRAVQGTVKDSSATANPENAVVMLLGAKDSTLAAFTRVQPNGSYKLGPVAAGNYILSVSHSRFAEYVDNVEVPAGNDDLKLANVFVTSKMKLLEAVIVKTTSAIRMKGDTTIFTADSFKVAANANVEDLLKKLPGLQVDKNGEIKAMGEKVEKVLVDGEEFFGDDPGMAVKNLRADAVKEVQVFDKKSDQAEFTGIDDGKTAKTINLKLKDNAKRGYFGKTDVAAGPVSAGDPRYNGTVMASSFKDKRKISAFAITSNTGTDRLGWQDEQKYGGGSDNMSFSMDDDGMSMMSWNGGGSDEEPYLDPQNGFLTNTNAGLNYSNKWKDKISLSSSPKYTKQIYDNRKSTIEQQYLPGQTFNRKAEENSYIDRHNFKLRNVADVKIDTSNTLKITLNTNFYHTESSNFRTSSTTDEFGNVLNSNTRFLNTLSDKTALSGNAVFKHKMKKARRTLSLSADVKNNNTEGENYLRSSTISKTFPFENLDQLRDYDRSTTNVSSNIVYTEPLGKNFAAEISYGLAINHGTNNQNTYSKDAITSKYDTPVDSLTNNFRQNILAHSPSLKLNYSDKKLKINAGAGFTISDFELEDLSRNITYDRNYVNFFPQANLRYNYKSNSSFNFNYTGATRQPTIDQLQNILNNNDPLNKFIGNPNLRPSFSNTFNLSHNTYNFLKDMWQYQSINFSATQNAITSFRITDASARTTSSYINTNGNFYVNMWSGWGFKVKKINTRFQLSPNGNYSKSVIFINGVKADSKNLNTGMQFYVQKEKDKKYDLSVSYTPSYTFNRISNNPSGVKYVTHDLEVNGTVYYKKVWSLQSDYNIDSRAKSGNIPGFTNSLWNARLQRTFAKEVYTFYFYVRDILNQNTGIERQFYNGFFTETRNDRLKRYVQLGFAWNFKNKPAAKK